MNVAHGFSRARGSIGSGMTPFFYKSAAVLVAAIAYVVAWSTVSQSLMGNDFFRIGTPSELADGLGGGGVVVLVTLIGALWLFMAGFAERGMALRERAHRIAELEAALAREADRCS